MDAVPIQSTPMATNAERADMIHDQEIHCITETLAAEVSLGSGMTMKTIWLCLEMHDDGPAWFIVRELEDWRWCSIATGTPLEMTDEAVGECIVYDIGRHMEGRINLWPMEDQNVVTLHRLIDGSEPPFLSGADTDIGGVSAEQLMRRSNEWRSRLRHLHERATK